MQQRQELEIQKRIQEQNDKLKECLKISNETVTISNETNLELYKQEEQIDRIDKKLDDVSDDLHKSKWLFRGIKSTFGMIKNIFTSPKKTKREKTPTKKRNEPENTKIPEQKATIEKNETKNPNDKLFQNPTIGKGIKEQDAILDEIMDTVHVLKKNAKLTSETLDAQDKKLDKINTKIDKNTKAMDSLNKDMKNYLK